MAEPYVSIAWFRVKHGRNQDFVLGHWTTVESYAQWQTIAAEGAPQEALNRMMDALEKNRPGVLVEPLD